MSRKGLFVTTPNRWFPIEFHTVLPLVHWLPKRQHGVELDGEPTVRRGHEQSLARHAPQLAQKLGLFVGAPDVLQHRAGVGVIEAVVVERQVAPVGPDEFHPRILALQEPRVVDPHGGDLVLPRMPGLQIVGVLVAAVAGGPDVDDGVGRSRRHGRHEAGEHLAALVAGDLDRQGFRLGQVVLGVDRYGLAHPALGEIRRERISTESGHVREEASAWAASRT